MNKGIKAALALGLCCVTAAGLFGCTKAAPEETTQPATVATQPAATAADTTVPESTTNTSTDTTTKPAETTTKKAKEDSGNTYTVNQALDALTNYYGRATMWTAPCLRATTTILPFIKTKRSTPPSKSICRPAMR